MDFKRKGQLQNRNSTSTVDCVVRFLVTFGLSFVIVVASQNVYWNIQFLPNLYRFTQPPLAWFGRKGCAVHHGRIGHVATRLP